MRSVRGSVLSLGMVLIPLHWVVMLVGVWAFGVHVGKLLRVRAAASAREAAAGSTECFHTCSAAVRVGLSAVWSASGPPLGLLNCKGHSPSPSLCGHSLVSWSCLRLNPCVGARWCLGSCQHTGAVVAAVTPAIVTSLSVCTSAVGEAVWDVLLCLRLSYGDAHRRACTLEDRTGFRAGLSGLLQSA